MPILTWLVSTHGWQSIFLIAGVIGVLYSLVWFLVYRNPGSASLSIRPNFTTCATVARSPIRKSVKFQWSVLGRIMAKRELSGIVSRKILAEFDFVVLLYLVSKLPRARKAYDPRAGRLVFDVAVRLRDAGNSRMRLLVGLDGAPRRQPHDRAKTPVVLGMALTAGIVAGNFGGPLRL